MVTKNEFSLLHSIYSAIAEKELWHSVPVPQGVEEALAAKDSASSNQPAAESWKQWLAVLDLAVNPHMLRSYITEQGSEEPTLVALIRFLVSKKPHSEADRDKVDWVVTHLFKKREEESHTLTGWPKAAIQDILRGFEFPPLSDVAHDLLMEIPSLLDEIKYYESFHELTDSRAIERGRDLKNQFGEEFFHPDVLTALLNYNLLFGMKFRVLFQEVAEKVHEFAQAQGEPRTPRTNELLQSDYRSTADAFRQLGELGRKETPSQPATGTDAVETSLEQRLKHLGVNSAQEAMYLRNRAQELAMRLRSNITLTTVHTSVAPLSLHDWESNSFRVEYPEREQSFRAEFARNVCYAIAISSRIYEEIPLYFEKKSTEYLWKRHYDSLVFLLYEGRKHTETLLKLSTVSQQRGLVEKAKQLQLTAEKMDGALAKAAAIL